MQQLTKTIKESTPLDTKIAIDTITNMTCSSEFHAPLNDDDLNQALSIDGEYLVLKMHYDEFKQELVNETIKYKISQSLSVIVSYEDDGKSYSKIEQFVNYISKLCDPKQNATFGIKKVDKLSEYPITLLFSGILPINQLTMHISQDIHDLIHSDEEYFKTRFQEFRDVLSQEVGIPILPVFPKLNTTLKPTQIMLIDLVTGDVVSRFETVETMDRMSIESYLVKLFYIYITLARKKSQH